MSYSDDIHNLAENELKDMCNDIYKWHKTGLLDGNGPLYKFSCKYITTKEDCRKVENDILNECLNRYSTIAKVLFIRYPSFFIK